MLTVFIYNMVYDVTGVLIQLQCYFKVPNYDNYVYLIVKFQKRDLDVTVTAFECLCGFASVSDEHFVLLGIYRPGSQVLSVAFLDELSAVFSGCVELVT